jgi:hypothetical protein
VKDKHPYSSYSGAHPKFLRTIPLASGKRL